ncbi:GIY-YIG nuclease family protein [Streptomyces sp. NPDC048288]|uniref:GIY-YIG nuclease family protein n=1 Tax=Streptomyces sp. NPDC048288 TaxID=3365529 RepID=UPI00371E89AB
MTAIPRPTGKAARIVERILLGLCWTTQAASLCFYTAITVQSPIWHRMWSSEPFTTACLGALTIGMAILWPISLREEQKVFYDRRAQRTYRKLSSLAHATVLLVASLAASVHSNRIGIWLLLGLAALYSKVTWSAWMRSRFLPAEDQAVIDAIQAREDEQASAIHDASQKELRRQRLSAVLTSLGYQLTDPDPVATPQSQDSPAQTGWTIPARKHAPLVYFIRNGNRLKIGTTTDLKRRIRTLALRAENVVLLLDGGQSLERELHKQFTDLRISNTEWFAYDGALIDFIADQNRIARKEEDQ